MQPGALARSFRLTGSDREASVSSSFIIRSITWMAVFSRVVGGMVQSNIAAVRVIPPYETTASIVMPCGFAKADRSSLALGDRYCIAARQVANRSTSMRVALFVTCLVDAVRPEIGFSALKLLESAGCEVVVPEAQTCCGQPAYNSGDSATARALAEKVLREFEGSTTSSIPSGSCGGQIKHHYLELFRDHPDLKSRAERARGPHLRTDRLPGQRAAGSRACRRQFAGHITYHDSCCRPARAGREDAAARAARQAARRPPDRDEGLRAVLRFRRHVLDQVRRHLRRDRR